MKPKVYAAGKIHKNDWRPVRRGGELIDTVELEKYVYVGPFFIGCDHGCFHGDNSHGAGDPIPSEQQRRLDSPNFDGYHDPDEQLRMWDPLRGEESGESIFDEDTMCGLSVRRSDVFELCKKQIESCDILYAYIENAVVKVGDGEPTKVDAVDCYGTLFEIGYAHALGKHIHLEFESYAVKHASWFIRLAGSSSVVYGKPDILGAVDAYNRRSSMIWRWGVWSSSGVGTYRTLDGLRKRTSEFIKRWRKSISDREMDRLMEHRRSMDRYIKAAKTPEEAKKRWFEWYATYMESDEWKKKSKSIRERDSYICATCSGRGWIVHHKSYDRVGPLLPYGGELPEDLETVCDDCHDKKHEKKYLSNAKHR